MTKLNEGSNIRFLVSIRAHPCRVLTVLSVEADLRLVLSLALQDLLQLLGDTLAGVRPVQEVTLARLLHDLRPPKAGELAEAVGAVHYGVSTATLSISQQEVAVWKPQWKNE